MSQSDQAFIRAYAEQGQRARTTRPSATNIAQQPAVSQPAPRQPVAQVNFNELYSGTVEIVGTFTPASPPSKPRPGQPINTPQPIPTPHARFVQPVQEKYAPEYVEPEYAEAEYTVEPLPASTSNRADAPAYKQWQLHQAHPVHATPDEAFAPEQIAGKIAPGNKPQPTRQVEALPLATPTVVPFRPAFEVEHFAWLPLIDNLCQQQQVGFDRVLLELIENPQAACRIIGVTSVKRGEGRTTLIQCLAKNAAEQGLRVCIVDLDDGNPQLAENLGLATDVGWESLLGTHKRLADVTIESMQDGISAVLLKHPLAIGAITKHAAQCQSILAELAEQYDLVLVDAAPAGDPLGTKQPNAPLSYPAADLGIERWLVVRDLRITSIADLARWQRRIADAGLVFLGVLENRAESDQLSALHQG